MPSVTVCSTCVDWVKDGLHKDSIFNIFVERTDEPIQDCLPRNNFDFTHSDEAYKVSW